jgi:hypothetical protein
MVQNGIDGLTGATGIKTKGELVLDLDNGNDNCS